MGIVLGIDFGTKRVGIAHTDPMQMIASGLCTIERSKAVAFIKDYCTKEAVETIAMGEPMQLDNTPSQSYEALQHFVKEVKNAVPSIPIVFIDERFTSKMAFQTMIDSGLKKKARRNKGLIDEISATIILQSYLEEKI